MTQKMKISLVLGDWSHDGHGLTDTLTVEVNLTPTQIEKAYVRGTKLIGVDLSREVCSNYEEHTMSEAHYSIFKKSGLLENFTPDDSWVDSDLFAELYLWVVSQGDPSFTYRFVINGAAINIGGYGLFE